MVTLFQMYYQLFKIKHLTINRECKGLGNFGCIDFIFFVVFQNSPWTVVSCLTKERQKVEYMLSSQTNLSLSTFTAKWVQVS